MPRCWRDITKECEKTKCCYDASCHALFEYWKFANSEEWEKMIRAEFQKEKICSTHFLVIDVKALKEVYAAFRSQRFEDSQLDSFMHRLEQSIGLRDEHGKLTLLGLEVTV